jgi:methylmalonyl-CoA mutase N-terminal domain/subunit
MGLMDERVARFETVSGIPLPRVATPADLDTHDYLRDLGFPGEPPFTRGAHPTMYRSRLWTVRPLAGFGTPEDNARFRYPGPGATGSPSLRLPDARG